jgi:5'-nucleotidase
MKTTIIFFTAYMMLLSATRIHAQTDTITILHMNDSHSGLAPYGPRTSDLKGTRGGIARAASVIGYTKMTGQNVLTLHAGDFSVGDIFYNAYFGVPELRILSALGLDAMTVGNHEFDLTPATLQQVLDTAFVGGGAFPLLSANCVLEDSSVRSLKKYIQSYTINNAFDKFAFSACTGVSGYKSAPDLFGNGRYTESKRMQCNSPALTFRI